MSEKKIWLGAQSLNPPETCELTAIIRGEPHHITAKTNTSILDSLLENKISPPFSCMTGSCCACMATLEEGEVHQQVQGGLPDYDLKENHILTCQAIPVSAQVKVNYE